MLCTLSESPDEEIGETADEALSFAGEFDSDELDDDPSSW